MKAEEIDKIAEKLTSDPGLVCPKCGERLSLECVSKAMDTSRISFSLEPHEGELLSALNVGKALAAMDRLLVVIGRDLGVQTTVNIEGIEFNDGGVKFNLLLARHDTKVRKRSEEADDCGD